MSKTSDKAAKAAERAKRWEEFRQQSVAAFMAASEQNKRDRELKAQKEANKMAKKRTTKSKGKAKRDLSHLKGPRTTFDKDKLMYRRNTGTVDNPIWDYSYHWTTCYKKFPHKEVLIRSVKHLNKQSTKTYADFLSFRLDLLQSVDTAFDVKDDVKSDDFYRLGSLAKKYPVRGDKHDVGADFTSSFTDLEATFARVDEELVLMAQELKDYGFEAPEWKLEKRRRGAKRERGPNQRVKAKIEKLTQLSFLTKISE